MPRISATFCCDICRLPSVSAQEDGMARPRRTGPILPLGLRRGMCMIAPAGGPVMKAAMIVTAVALGLCGAPALAQDVPAALFTDPPHGAAHPARMEVLHIPSGGSVN